MVCASCQPTSLNKQSTYLPLPNTSAISHLNVDLCAEARFSGGGASELAVVVNSLDWGDRVHYKLSDGVSRIIQDITDKIIVARATSYCGNQFQAHI